MAEPNPSYRNPCVLSEGEATPSLLAATSSLPPPHAEHYVSVTYSIGVEFQPFGPISRTFDQPEVPIDAERLLAWITKPDRLEVVLDIFDVGFRNRVQRNGIASARRWYWWQVARTLGESVLQLSPRIAAFIYLLRRIVSFLFGS